MPIKLYLTFDCEDFINDRSILVLYNILKLLQKHHMKGIFFLTGHIAEKISHYSEIISLLNDHEIGYHSSAHSVRPTIHEYTDVENYSLARFISYERESSHINPITGEPEGKGGISKLQEVFPNKKIVSFRAPHFSFSPPHIEALREYGICYDFSTNISPKPIHYRKITFYPYPDFFDVVKVTSILSLFRSLLKYGISVLDIHPNYMANKIEWDRIYFSGNPKKLIMVETRSWKETGSLLLQFKILLKILKYLHKSRMLEVTPIFERGEMKLSIDNVSVEKCYKNSIIWIRQYLGINPRYIHQQFMDFFRQTRN